MDKFLTCWLLLSLALLASCSSKPVTPPVQNAGTYFQEGEEFFEKGLYKDAIASWEKVRDSYFSPELNTLAELKIAESHFLAEEYVEAAVAYDAFLKNHPGHPRVADVLYQLGLANAYQILAFDQDQTATIQALNTFQKLKKDFPEDRRIEEVQIYIDRCNNQLAISELSIGEFYLRSKIYSASIQRLESLLKKYPQFDERDKAYYFLGQAYLLNGDNDKALVAFNTLFNDYDGSEFIADAQSLMEKHN